MRKEVIAKALGVYFCAESKIDNGIILDDYIVKEDDAVSAQEEDISVVLSGMESVWFRVFYIIYKYCFFSYICSNDNDESLTLDSFRSYIKENESVFSLFFKTDTHNCAESIVKEEIVSKYCEIQKNKLHVICMNRKHKESYYSSTFSAIEENLDLFIDNDNWEKIIARWKEEEKAERMILEMRITQHGKKTAFSKWYSNYESLTVFNDWYNHVYDNILKTAEAYKNEYTNKKNERTDKVNSTIEKILSRYKEDECAKFLSVEMVVSVFLQIVAKEYSFDICDFHSIVFENNQIKIKLYDYELYGEENEISYIAQKKQTDSFSGLQGSETYTEDQGISGSILVLCDEEILETGFFHVGTNNKDDGRQSYQHNSAYKILYQKSFNEKNYEFYNYWEFPLFDLNGKLFAVFRVVNHRANDENENGLNRTDVRTADLELNERIELLQLSSWFEKILLFSMNLFHKPILSEETKLFGYFDDYEFCEEEKQVASYGKGKAKYNHEIWDSITEIKDKNFWNNSEIGKLCKEAGECISEKDYIGQNVFKEALEHLIITANKKNEHRNIGCTLLLINGDDKDDKLKVVKEKTKSLLDKNVYNNKSFEEIGKIYYKKYTPDTAFFVYRTVTEGKKITEKSTFYEFSGIQRLIYKRKFEDGHSSMETYVSPSDAKRGITECSNGVCISLDGNSKSISIYYKKKKQAICYLSQSTGKWKIRRFSEINRCIEEIQNNQENENETKRLVSAVNRIFPVVLHMSRIHEGSMIIISLVNNDPVQSLGGAIDIPLDSFENNFDPDNSESKEFITYLSLDGAVAISDEKAYKAGVILPSQTKSGFSDLVEKLVKECDREKYKATLEFLENKGSRHNTAACFSLSNNTCVFVVSENGGISLFVRGQAVLIDW